MYVFKLETCCEGCLHDEPFIDHCGQDNFPLISYLSKIWCFHAFKLHFILPRYRNNRIRGHNHVLHQASTRFWLSLLPEFVGRLLVPSPFTMSYRITFLEIDKPVTKANNICSMVNSVTFRVKATSDMKCRPMPEMVGPRYERGWGHCLHFYIHPQNTVNE